MSADHDTSQPARQHESIQWCPRCERGAGDAEQCPACEGATVAREPDPLGIVPEGFVANWRDAAAETTLSDALGESWAPMRADDVTSLSDALAVAERAPSTTDERDMDRCRYCGSVKISRLDPTAPQESQREGVWVCNHCDETFDTPLPARSELPTRHGGDRPVCPDCGSIRLVDGFSGELECLDCAWLGERAIDASAYSEPGQATLGEVTR